MRHVSVMSYYPQLKFFAFHVENSCAVIAHHTEQQCGLGFALPPEESRIGGQGNCQPYVCMDAKGLW